MLEEFTVDNYKSLINVTFRPQPENLLLGKNNAGKTNLCQALQFLAATASLPLDDCADRVAGGRFGLTNFYLKKDTVDFTVKVTVPFNNDQLHYEYYVGIRLTKQRFDGPSLEVDSETLRMTGLGYDDVSVLENTAEGIGFLDEQGQQIRIEPGIPRGATTLCGLHDMMRNSHISRFKSYLSTWRYYLMSSVALRGADHKSNETVLNSDGSNLASAVYQLKTSNERLYRRLLDHLRRIDPRIDLINFAVPTSHKVFMFFEDKAGNRVPAECASNGTLCYLALTYLLSSQRSVLGSALLIIEEPENGIYVGLLKDLLEMAEESPWRPQLIFTTHSPYFIDLFDNRLDGVFVMRGGQEHSTLTQPDPEQVKRRLEDFPLGEQHFREMLT